LNQEKVEKYTIGAEALPEKQLTWPLYGSGIDHLGIHAAPVVAELPEYSDEELLVRIDAVSLCYTDVKEIDQGQNHPRLVGRDLSKNPIIPGHEISITVVAAGEKLRDQYPIGKRFTMQPDVWVNGKSIPFCFGIDGGYRQYAKIGHEILHGDAGNYLIPIPDNMSYAASAITEPWACVEASYRMTYRDELKPGGNVLIWGNANSRSGYQVDEGWLITSKPGTITICDLPKDFKKTLIRILKQNGIEHFTVAREEIKSGHSSYDDIILLDARVEDINWASECLKDGGVIALLDERPSPLPIDIDLGRLHYDNIIYVGTLSRNLNEAYQATVARTELKSHGTTWILGAGGPMGRMHLQRALEATPGPNRIIATEISRTRMDSLRDFFLPLARQHGKELIHVNPVEERALFRAAMGAGGIDDFEVMVTNPKLVSEACAYISLHGSVINLFAGVKRGVKACIDARLIFGERQVRIIGHSGSGLDDQKVVVKRFEQGQLKPELSVAAIGGMKQISDGIRAMKNVLYPGKIVIFPQVPDFPLLSLEELSETLPEVFNALGPNGTWTFEAEKIFLAIALP